MPDYPAFTPDQFPAGCLVTAGCTDNGERKIIFASRYFSRFLGVDADSLIDMPLSHLLTPASIIFFDSYMIPMLSHEGRCEEILLEIKSAAGDKIPVVANAAMDESDDQLVFWTLSNASQRNQLYQDFVDSRRQLEESSVTLYEQSITDSLTGIWNRYRMEQAIDAEINAAERHDRPFAVLLFDIDHFKHFNDTYGHEAGDEVLVTLSSVLQNKLRPTDNLGRWGGEEFLVLASDCNLAGGMHLAERLRQSAEALNLGKLGGVTISVGVATWRPGESPKVLIARADQAMYWAKEGGRNQVEAEASSTISPLP